ncbi:hypothetical protein Tco_0865383 [Tanacetum coccineum]
MAIPEDHLAKFHKMTDAKEMWEAIKSRFGDGLHKVYEKGPFTESSDSTCIHRYRTKPGVDSISFDDLYNNLRVFETDVKGSTGSSFSAQNVAFVYSESTSSTNDVSTAYGATTSSGYNSQRENSSSYTDELMHSIFANQSSGGHDFHEIEEVLQEDRDKAAEELKHFDTIDGDGVDWTGHAEDEQENFALMGLHFNEFFDSHSSDVEDAPVYDDLQQLMEYMLVSSSPSRQDISMPP